MKTVYVNYKKFVTLPTENDDESPFPKAFDKAIKLFAAYTLLAQFGDNKNITKANSKLSRFKQEMAKLYNAHLLPDRENIRYKTAYRSRTAQRTSFGRVTNPHKL